MHAYPFLIKSYVLCLKPVYVDRQNITSDILANKWSIQHSLSAVSNSCHLSATLSLIILAAWNVNCKKWQTDSISTSD